MNVRKILLPLLLLMGCLVYPAAQLKAEDVTRMDFAARFMYEIGESDSTVEYITVGPEMMEKVEAYMQENKEEEDEGTSEMIPHIKSVRLIRAATNGQRYHEQAVALFRKNPGRYTSATDEAAETDSCQLQLWIRMRGEAIVELVVLKLFQAEDRFELVDLTGEMDKKTLMRLSKAPL